MSSRRQLVRHLETRLWSDCRRSQARRFSIRPISASQGLNQDIVDPSLTFTDLSGNAPDAQFEILDGPSPVLSAKLSASQNLYTRRGTLLGLNGNPENATSTLNFLSPLLRAPLQVPFLYQKLSSTSPITLYIASQRATSLTTLKLDGTVDWRVLQRDGLLAWTGESLVISPSLNRSASLSRLGSSYVKGRGMAAIAGRGQLYEVNLEAGENFILNPANVLAHTVTKASPTPYRLQYSTFKFQIPGLQSGRLVPEIKFFRVMSESDTWKFLSKWAFKLRMWARRSIWGDRLFLRFQGPTQIIMQSQGSSMRELLTPKETSELASYQPGALNTAVQSAADDVTIVDKPTVQPTTISTARVVDGKVTFTKN